MNIRAFIVSLIISLFPVIASAHVVVKPATAGVASFQTFTMGVPSEKSIATVSLRLMLPAGLEYVSPTVKPGWNVTVKKDSTTGMVTEIDWYGGKVPAGQRDDFSFSAKVPAEMTVLSWKAYQKYADGTTVAWDKDPAGEQVKDASGKDDFSQSGPYSMTKVSNDLQDAGAVGQDASEIASFVLSVVALVVAGLALARTKRNPYVNRNVL